MRRRVLSALLSVTMGLAIAPCSNESGDRALTTTSTQATPDSPATATSVSTATSSPDATAQPAVIAPDGLGVARFGDPAEAVVAKLKEKFGAPDRDFTQPDCAPEVTRTLEWDALTVNFSQTFIGYMYATAAAPHSAPRPASGRGPRWPS
jgi:hypothetical protein